MQNELDDDLLDDRLYADENPERSVINAHDPLAQENDSAPDESEILEGEEIETIDEKGAGRSAGNKQRKALMLIAGIVLFTGVLVAIFSGDSQSESELADAMQSAAMPDGSAPLSDPALLQSQPPETPTAGPTVVMPQPQTPAIPSEPSMPDAPPVVITPSDEPPVVITPSDSEAPAGSMPGEDLLAAEPAVPPPAPEPAREPSVEVERLLSDALAEIRELKGQIAKLEKAVTPKKPARKGGIARNLVVVLEDGVILRKRSGEEVPVLLGERMLGYGTLKSVDPVKQQFSTEVGTWRAN